MLSDALKTLSASPSAGEKKLALAEVNSKITMLESQLGISPKLLPLFNPAKAAARLAELQRQLAAKGVTSAPAAASPTAPEPKDEPSGSEIVDAIVKATGSHSLAEFQRKAERRRLSATVAATHPGTLSRACAERNLSNSH